MNANHSERSRTSPDGDHARPHHAGWRRAHGHRRVASELQKTWHRDDVEEWAKVYTQIFPPYQLLIESYQRAREVENKGEQLDSMRA